MELMDRVQTPWGPGTVIGFDHKYLLVLMDEVFVQDEHGVFHYQKLGVRRDEVTKLP